MIVFIQSIPSQDKKVKIMNEKVKRRKMNKHNVKFALKNLPFIRNMFTKKLKPIQSFDRQILFYSKLRKFLDFKYVFWVLKNVSPKTELSLDSDWLFHKGSVLSCNKMGETKKISESSLCGLGPDVTEVSYKSNKLINPCIIR